MVGAKRKRQQQKQSPLPAGNKSDKEDAVHILKDSSREGEKWSKSKKKRMRKLKAKLLRNSDGSKRKLVANNNETTSDQNDGRQRRKRRKEKKPEDIHNNDKKENIIIKKKQEISLPSSTSSSSSELQKSFSQRLAGSRFRLLNEELYTTDSSASFKRFSENPELFNQYHTGFRKQVEQWPVNPIDEIVSKLIKTHTNVGSDSKIKRKIVVADFGCGDAALAQKLMQIQNSPFQVHSFDLVAANDLVTACDCTDVPLQSGTVDVGIFCLALMGTNLADFVREAHRVLKKDRSKLYIAEVRSRFTEKEGKHSFSGFLELLQKLGFECTLTDKSNKMFFLLELRKLKNFSPNKRVQYTAKACIYKKR